MSKKPLITCAVCGVRRSNIYSHIVNKHKIGVNQYENKYGKIDISSTILEQNSFNLSKSVNSIPSICKICKCKSNNIYKHVFVNHSIDAATYEREYVLGIKDNHRIEGIDYVKCAICGVEKKSLVRHLVKHSMPTAEYERLFGKVQCLVTISKGQRALSNRSEKVYTRSKNERMEERYSNLEEGEFVICKICNKKRRSLVCHLRKHKITPKEYVDKYGGPLKSEITIKRNADKKRGVKHTDITKEKMSRSHLGNQCRKGIHHTEEAKLRMSKSQKASYADPEVKQDRLSKVKDKWTFKGKKHSKETREIMSSKQKERKKREKELNIEINPTVRRMRSLVKRLREGLDIPSKYNKNWEIQLVKFFLEEDIHFNAQHVIPGERHCYDNLASDYQVIIELDQCFIHGCTIHYKDNEKAQSIRRNDERLTQFAFDKGYSMLRIWWHDYEFNYDGSKRSVVSKENHLRDLVLEKLLTISGGTFI